MGQYAIQLAKFSGFKVATTASPSRWDGLKALGADIVVDYKVSQLILYITRSWTGSSVNRTPMSSQN